MHSLHSVSRVHNINRSDRLFIIIKSRVGYYCFIEYYYTNAVFGYGRLAEHLQPSFFSYRPLAFVPCAALSNHLRWCVCMTCIRRRIWIGHCMQLCIFYCVILSGYHQSFHVIIAMHKRIHMLWKPRSEDNRSTHGHPHTFSSSETLLECCEFRCMQTAPPHATNYKNYVLSLSSILICACNHFYEKHSTETDEQEEEREVRFNTRNYNFVDSHSEKYGLCL